MRSYEFVTCQSFPPKSESVPPPDNVHTSWPLNHFGGLLSLHWIPGCRLNNRSASLAALINILSTIVMAAIHDDMIGSRLGVQPSEQPLFMCINISQLSFRLITPLPSHINNLFGLGEPISHLRPSYKRRPVIPPRLYSFIVCAPSRNAEGNYNPLAWRRLTSV